MCDGMWTRWTALGANFSKPAAVRHQRALGPVEDEKATAQLKTLGMTIREMDRSAFLAAAQKLWQAQARELDAESWLRTIGG